MSTSKNPNPRVNEADRLMTAADNSPSPTTDQILAAAQVNATLALAAETERLVQATQRQTMLISALLSVKLSPGELTRVNQAIDEADAMQ